MVQAGKKPQRKTQSERSASSRAKIIDAAVYCLAAYGYSATTMNRIAGTAKMTTGRMQHQFSTKAQIMAAVVEFVYRENTNVLSLDRLTSDSPLDRVREYIHVLREVFEQDYVLATLEIRLAMRSDEELTEAVKSLIKSYDARSFNELESLLVETGMSDDDAYAWMRVMIAIVRGLSLERVLDYQIGRGADTEVMLTMLLDRLISSDRHTELSSEVPATGSRPGAIKQ
jgi:AcrR family transcriptional regulator